MPSLHFVRNEEGELEYLGEPVKVEAQQNTSLLKLTFLIDGKRIEHDVTRAVGGTLMVCDEAHYDIVNKVLIKPGSVAAGKYIEEAAHSLGHAANFRETGYPIWDVTTVKHLVHAYEELRKHDIHQRHLDGVSVVEIAVLWGISPAEVNRILERVWAEGPKRS